MNAADVTNIMREYEQSHNVCSYRYLGYPAWPMLRHHLSSSISAQFNGTNQRARRDSNRLQFRRQIRLAPQLGRSCLGYVRNPRVPLRCEAVLMTHSNRSQKIDGVSYNFLTAPLAELFEQRGIRSVFWQTGPPLPKNHQETWPIQGALWIQLRRHLKSIPRAAAPPWFRELSHWMKQIGLFETSDSLVYRMRRILAGEQVFRRWFQMSGASILMADMWCNWISTSAILAAHACDMLAVDLQHGVLFEGNYEYTGWFAACDEFQSMVPDYFWLWGQWARDTMAHGNVLFRPEQLLAGGNPWLNMWKQRHALVSDAIDVASRLTRGHRKVGLLTLQTGVPWREQARDILRRTTDDWLWLIRLHRNMPGNPGRIERELREDGFANVDVVQASQQPLYALLQQADWHVTWWSSCAMEALAFTCPTLLLAEQGRDIYKRFINKGVMHYAADPDTIAEILESHVDPALFEHACHDAFAPEERAPQAMDHLIARMPSRFGSPG